MTNILLLHAHDLGRFLGAYGVATVNTPHLDALAAEATQFDAAFSTAPHCSPARASLFTGTYPQTNGVLGLTHEPFGWDLHDPSSHLAHRLSTHGYSTELIGVHHESKVLADADIAARLGFYKVCTGGARDVVVERTKAALSAAAGSERPFYLQVGFNEPHRTPSHHDSPGVMGFLAEGVSPDTSRGLTVPAYLRDDAGAREEMAELQGAVRHLDEGVGSILAHLDALGLRGDTVVVFTTDHGLALPRAKCTLYDSGLGVALLMRVPGRPGWGNQRVSSMVSHVDVVPTLLELLGLPTAADVTGASLVPVVESDVPSRAHAFAQLSYHTYFDPKRCVRSDTHKLIVNFSNAPRAMDPTQSWLHRSAPAELGGPTIPTSEVFELYDLTVDPDEADNLASGPGHEGLLAELATALLDWMRGCGDPLLTATNAPPRHRLALAALHSAANHAGLRQHAEVLS
ncbi:sulfatase family protein [Arthrobacter sp. 35W]|uniref:sulfatase family protein n=1 Tax=Arthrobacter sp. 35W TaxID=1132441 RepID=UPI00040C1549|nr:sulfatase [Arthrobacter sp. 35W]